MQIKKLRRHQLRSVKRAFTTRRVPSQAMATIISGDIRPKAGDLVLARVSELGKHQRVELINGRRARIFPGDTILVAFGNRYAPDQFEALIGDDLSGCDLVAGGGVASREICRHERMPEPTRIQPIGLVGTAEGQPINLRDYRVEPAASSPQIPVVFVTGTAMNSGKTMTSGSLVRGFRQDGRKVAGIKATGTGSGGDLWFMSDMGANHVMDFTDAGFASTYKAEPEEILQGLLALIGRAEKMKCEVAVVEIADGLQHEETAELLRDDRVLESCVGVVFAAYDSLGAAAGVRSLTQNGYRVFALSGQITRSPLARREAMTALDLPVLSPLEIQAGVLNDEILSAERIVRQRTKPISSGDAKITVDLRNEAARRVRNRIVPPTSAPWQLTDRTIVRSIADTDFEIMRWLEGREPNGGPATIASVDRAGFEKGDVSDAD